MSDIGKLGAGVVAPNAHVVDGRHANTGFQGDLGACSVGSRWVSHVMIHTSHLTPHTSHLTPHTSHLKPHTPHLTPHTPHISHLLWSRRVSAEKFFFGKRGHPAAMIRQLVLAGLPTTRTWRDQAKGCDDDKRSQ